MPLKAATILAVHRGQVELTAEIVDGSRDTPDALIAAVRARLLEHQSEIMTDRAILDPDSVSVASAFVSRDPLGPGHHDGLSQLGLSATQTDGGGKEEGSLFSRLSRNRRTQLDRWVLGYLRARDLTPRMASFESALVEGIEVGELTDEDWVSEASEQLAQSAGSAFGLRLSPGGDGLSALDDALLKDKGTRPGRWVLHPACALALAAFTGESIRQLAPHSSWTDDPDAPLHVRAKGGAVVATDPMLRVIDLVVRGRQARLTDYADAVVRQSLTSGART